jgi:tRNA(adenine34) deaminase
VPTLTDEDFMHQAIALARSASAAGEVPVGALITIGNRVVAEGWNEPIATHDPTAHAEVVVLRAAAKHARNYRLGSATLYVTLEPCAMCAGALVNARIARVVFGAWDPRAGACGSVVDLPRALQSVHRIDAFGGVCAQLCRELLGDFFGARR